MAFCGIHMWIKKSKNHREATWGKNVNVKLCMLKKACWLLKMCKLIYTYVNAWLLMLTLAAADVNMLGPKTFALSDRCLLLRASSC